jgi:glycosyltransferase involved in cell wall biosynthesis
MTLHQRQAKLSPTDDITRQIVFLFVGDGAQRKTLEQEIAFRKLDNVTLQPYQPRELLAQVLGAADIHLLSLKPELEGLLVPSKFYGIAAAGRPAIFIGSSEGEIAHLVEETKCGITIQSGDSKALLEGILDLARNRERSSAMGERARFAFENRWDKRHALTQWLTVIDAVASRSLPSAMGADGPKVEA